MTLSFRLAFSFGAKYNHTRLISTASTLQMLLPYIEDFVNTIHTFYLGLKDSKPPGVLFTNLDIMCYIYVSKIFLILARKQASASGEGKQMCHPMYVFKEEI